MINNGPRALLESDADWPAIAELLALQLVFSTSFDDTLRKLDDNHRREMESAGLNPLVDEPVGFSRAHDFHVALQLLRDLNRGDPTDDITASTIRTVARVIERGQLDLARDPVQDVLVSPRLGRNFIERIVRSVSGRVRTEVLRETGWARIGGDLRLVLSGRPLPRAIAHALSGEGILDALPTEECLAKIRLLDPQASVSGPTQLADGGGAPVQYHSTRVPAVTESGSRITEAELLDDSRASDARFGGSDVTDAAMAAELLWRARGLWRSVTLEVEAPENGPFRLRLFDTNNPLDQVLPTSRLHQLVARRYEAAEAIEQRAWRNFTFVVSRAELPEWKCDLRYQFA